MKKAYDPFYIRKGLSFISVIHLTNLLIGEIISLHHTCVGFFMKKRLIKKEWEAHIQDFKESGLSKAADLQPFSCPSNSRARLQ